jgi:tetratricopeptide (TPR) repeat protein
LERQARQGGPAWLEAKEGLINAYSTLGRSGEVIALATELLPHKKNALEKAGLYRQIGYACYKQGDWKSSEDHLVTGLELLGQPFPRTRAGLIAGLLQELVLFALNTTRRWWYLHKRQRLVQPEDTEIIQLYQGLGWSFILSDALKFLLLTFRILRHAETRMGQCPELAFGLAGHASLLMHLAWFQQSLVYHQKGLELRQELNDEYGIGQSLQLLGYYYCWRGDYLRSLDEFQLGKAQFNRIGDPWQLGMTIQGMGHCQFYRGDYGQALESFESFAEIGRKIQDHYTLSDADLWFCYIYTEKGDFAKAEEHGRLALAVSEQHGIQYIVCCSLIHLGYMEVERKNWAQARDYLEQGKRLFEHSTFLRNYTIYVYPYLAQAWLDEYRQPGKACDADTRRRIRKLCLEAGRKTRPWINHHGLSLRVLGNYYAWIGQDRSAEKYFLRSLRLQERLGRRFELAKSCEDYALYLYSRKRPAEARQCADRAFALYKEIGSQACLEALAAVLRPAVSSMEEQQDRFQEKLELFSIINAGHFLSSILDLNLLLEKIMAICLEVTGAERGFLFLYPEEKNAEQVLQVKVARSVEMADFKAGEAAVSWTVIRKVESSRKPLNVLDASLDEELASQRSVVRHGLRSILCLPLIAKRELMGLIYLDNRLVGGLFTEEKIKLLKILVNQAAISIENARLYREMKEKTRMEEELRLGREIQMKLLPRQTPESTGLKLKGLMEPAKEIGGDYYDFIPCDEGRRLAIVVGDVTGKGVAAGLVMATAKAIFHSLSDLGIGPREILLQANQILSTDLDGEKLMTVSYLEWDAERKIIRYANAGHEPVILCRPVRPAGAEVSLLKCRGIFIGLTHDLADKFEEAEVAVQSGDKLLIYTL